MVCGFDKFIEASKQGYFSGSFELNVLFPKDVISVLMGFVLYLSQNVSYLIVE